MDPHLLRKNVKKIIMKYSPYSSEKSLNSDIHRSVLYAKLFCILYDVRVWHPPV